jgi:predicted ATP-grasp superfamily ATP-dependent carboligase
MPNYGGTLAAARALGALGVEVTVAGEGVLAPARWSRATRRFERCPSPRQPAAFLEWLISFGRRNPVHFLYPTSDDLAWLLARHAGRLREHFLLFQPPMDSLLAVLDKQRLYLSCREVGLSTVPTRFPRTPEDVALLGRELRRPLVIKPRTQVFLASENKGSLVGVADDLPALYRRWMERNRYLPGPETDFGPLAAPMLQEFRSTDTKGVYSISGFMDRDGTLVGARASRKLLQRPRLFGVGICFEDAPVQPEVLGRLVALCRRMGYFGVFEAEFLVYDEIHHLIDFNPRYYGQMHFECARGLPLPVFAYLAAVGDRDRLRALADEAASFDSHGYRYALRFANRFHLRMRRLAGTSNADEAAQWARWMDASPGRLVDPSVDPGDRAPGRVQALAEVWSAVRHPRAYLRASVLDRA